MAKGPQQDQPLQKILSLRLEFFKGCRALGAHAKMLILILNLMLIFYFNADFNFEVLPSPYLRGSARAKKIPSFFPRSASLPFSGKAKEINEVGKHLPLAYLLARTPDAAWSQDTGEGDRVLGASPGSSPPTRVCPMPSTPPSSLLYFLASHLPSTREEHCHLASRN